MNSERLGNGEQLTREEEAMFNEIVEWNPNPEDASNQPTTPGYNENQKSNCVGGHDACLSFPSQHTPSTTGKYDNHPQPLGGQGMSPEPMDIGDAPEYVNDPGSVFGMSPEPMNIGDAPEYVNGPGSVFNPTFTTQNLSPNQLYDSRMIYPASTPGFSQQIPMAPVNQYPLLDSFTQTRTPASFGQPNPIEYLLQQVPLAPAIQHIPGSNISVPMYTTPGTESDPLNLSQSHGNTQIPVINQPCGCAKCHGYNGSHNNFQHNLMAQGGQNIQEAVQPDLVIPANYPLLNADSLAYNAFSLSHAGYLVPSSRFIQQMPMAPVNQPPMMDSCSQTWWTEDLGQSNRAGYFHQQVPLSPTNYHLPANRSQPKHMATGKTLDRFNSSVYQNDAIQNGHGNRIDTINGTFNNLSSGIRQNYLEACDGQNFNQGIEARLRSSTYYQSPHDNLFPIDPALAQNFPQSEEQFIAIQNGNVSSQTSPNQSMERFSIASHSANTSPQDHVSTPPLGMGPNTDELPSSQQPPIEVLPSKAALIRLHCPYPKCAVVLAATGRNSNFIAHLVKHRNVKQAQCLVCSPPHTYKRDADCCKHVKELVPDFEYNREFYIRVRKEKEIRAELEKCGFKCSKCNTLYAKPSDVREHWRVAHPMFKWKEDTGIVTRTDEMIREDVRKDDAWIDLVGATKKKIAQLTGKPRRNRKSKKKPDRVCV